VIVNLERLATYCVVVQCVPKLPNKEWCAQDL